MFIRYISHEIRTPLNTVIMGFDVLKEEMVRLNEPKERLDTVDEMRTSCEAAINILNNILTSDKLETSSLQLEKQEVNALQLIRSTVNPFVLQVCTV